MQNLIESLSALDGKDSEAVEASIGIHLYNEVVRHSPDLIVEIGTGHGYSTTWMLHALEYYDTGEIITFDEVDRDPFVWEGFYKSTPKLTRIVGKLDENIEKINKLVDFVFMDGAHSIDKIVKDIELIEPKLSSRAIIYVHDTTYIEKMGNCLKDYFNGIESKQLKEIPLSPSKSEWIYQELKIGSGLGIARKRGNESYD